MSDKPKYPRAGEGSYFDHSYLRYLKVNNNGGNIGFLVEKGMPRFKAYLNDPAEKAKGAITIKMNPVHLNALKEMVDMVVDKKVNGLNLDLVDHVFAGGVRSEAPQMVARITVHRNERTEVEMIFVAKGRSKVILNFASKFDWHNLTTTDNGALPGHLASEINAKAIVGDWLSLLQNTQIHDHKPEHHEKRNGPSRGANNRNFNNDRSGFGGNQQEQRRQAPAADSWTSTDASLDDDDVDF